MAKTAFVDNGVNGGRGTQVMAAHMLGFNNHVHDGTDFDGHVSKINLAEHTTGLLSLANQVTGKLSELAQWDSVVEFDINWVGFSNSPYSQAIAFKSEQVQIPVLGSDPATYVYKKFVRLLITGFSGVSNQNYLNAAVGAIPAGYRPSRVVWTNAIAIAGADTAVVASVGIDSSTGLISVYILSEGTLQYQAFPITGNKGLYDLDLTYEVPNS